MKPPFTGRLAVWLLGLQVSKFAGLHRARLALLAKSFRLLQSWPSARFVPMSQLVWLLRLLVLPSGAVCSETARLEPMRLLWLPLRGPGCIATVGTAVASVRITAVVLVWDGRPMLTRISAAAALPLTTSAPPDEVACRRLPGTQAGWG